MADPSRTTTLTLTRHLGKEYAELPSVRAVLHGPKGQRAEAALLLGPVTVGTGPDCELVAEDGAISRAHCQLTLTSEGVRLRDLSSKNGTFVGGARVREVVLVPGVEVTLGGSRLELRPGEGVERVPLHESARFGAVLGASLSMRALFERLERAAPTDQPVLLLGESGTGKELLARALHDASPRRDEPFVVLDCAAIAPQLIEAELFGHAKGAFTGAEAPREGLLVQADGGTLFLDELGELPLELQPRLLRALETGEVRPVGGDAYRRTDVRVIAATHRDLRARARDGGFRADLYYRVAVVEAEVPPLRERKEDIPLLVEHFLRLADPPRTWLDLPSHALDLLQAHDWPGNVRELRNTVTRLLLYPAPAKREALAPGAARKALGFTPRLPLREARDAVVAEFEKSYLVEVLQEHGGNVSAAARVMGVSRQFVHRLMARYDVRGRDG